MDIKKCKVEWCIKEAKVKGYCTNHNTQMNLRGKIGEPRTKKIVNKSCSITDCLRDYYAKGYCQHHYNTLVLHPKKSQKCIVPECNHITLNGYCSSCLHKIKLAAKYGIPVQFALTNDCHLVSMKGVNNPRWNGGTSQYPNHGDLKRARLRKLESVNYTCEVCGEFTIYVHHKDGKKDNHSDSNLYAACRECHTKLIHKGRKNSKSKFRTLYGATIQEIAKSLKVSPMTVYSLHIKDKLMLRINPPLDFQI
jgi:hypothetical protein